VEGIWRSTHWWVTGLCQALAVGESRSVSGRAWTPEDVDATPQVLRQQFSALSQCLCSCWVDFSPAIAWDTSDISLQKLQAIWPVRTTVSIVSFFAFSTKYYRANSVPLTSMLLVRHCYLLRKRPWHNGNNNNNNNNKMKKFLLVCYVNQSTDWVTEKPGTFNSPKRFAIDLQYTYGSPQNLTYFPLCKHYISVE
jgi:hypothetical protein